MVLCPIDQIPVKPPIENREKPLPNPVTCETSEVTHTGNVVSALQK